MAIFQINLLEKRISGQMQAVKPAYEKYCDYFHNPAVQRNIRNSKEEQYQEGFLRELFVNILGYTINPCENYNLISEQKNEYNPEKADAAILINGDVRAVIELKNVHIHLNDAVKQAFNYKYHHRNAAYVIISNFETLRFYIDNALDYLEWNLFTLSEKDFASLWICLAYQNIKNDIAEQIKNESLENEKDITLRFYCDYKQFKNVLYADLIGNNPQYDKLTLFKAAQKILDRIIFLCFAEDNNLIPPNTIESHILAEWKYLDNIGEYRTLYDCFKKYFRLVDTGAKNKKPCDIYGYNGGLFRGGEELELTINDELLKNHTQQLCRYNFLQRMDYRSEIDINILGHIFEHSLTEIETIEEELLSAAPPQAAGMDSKVKTVRKDFGIFYTPQYITEFLLDETLGKLCRGKKAELGLDLDLSNLDELRNKKAKKKGQLPPELAKLKERFEKYRDWLLTVTVCDPACGSGAFLNAALDFFIAEHHYIDERLAKIEGLPIVQTMVGTTEILNRSIFGADINEDSIEITKLALWIHSAKREEKLGFLDGNIKHGDSLLAPPQAAGDNIHKLNYHLDWQSAFPQVFAAGGFDVIVCNPPYHRKDKQSVYAEHYQWNTDLYLMFIERIFGLLLKQNGQFGVIVPRYWLVNRECTDFRRFMLTEINITKLAETAPFRKAGVEIKAQTENVLITAEYMPSTSDDIQILDEVFDANDVKEKFTVSGIIKKSYCLENEDNTIITAQTPEIVNVLKKIETDTVHLGTVSESKRGMEIGKKHLEDAGTVYTLIGKDVLRYCISGGYNTVEEQHPEYQRLKTFFDKTDLYLRRVAPALIAAKAEKCFGKKYAYNKNIYGIALHEGYKPLYVLALLNSKLMSFYYRYKFSMKKIDLFPEIQAYLFNRLPVKNVNSEVQKSVIVLAERLLKLNRKLTKMRDKSINTLARTLTIIPSKKIRQFETVKLPELLSEIESRISESVKMKKHEDFQEYLTQTYQICRRLRRHIAETGRQLDATVYQLYGLTREEINIIEN